MDLIRRHFLKSLSVLLVGFPFLKINLDKRKCNFADVVEDVFATSFYKKIQQEQIKPRDIVRAEAFVDDALCRYGRTGWYGVIDLKDGSRLGYGIDFPNKKIKHINTQGIEIRLTKALQRLGNGDYSKIGNYSCHDIFNSYI